MGKGIIICLYSMSGLMEQPFLDAGYEVHSFDGQLTDGVEGNWHKHFAWFDPDNLRDQAEEILRKVGGSNNVKLVIGFPPCDDLAVSGTPHFAKKLAANPNCQVEAAERAKLVGIVGEIANCPWAAENPVSVLASLWRKPNFYFEPYHYGGYLPDHDEHPLYPEYINANDAYPKKTCLWTGNGFSMPPRKPVDVPRRSDGTVAYSEQYKRLGGKSLKTKNIRSATPRGFAKALCEHLENMV